MIGLIPILILEKRYYKATRVDFGLSKSSTFKAILIGIVISAFLILGLFFLPNLHTFRFSIPRDWLAYLVLFFNFLLVSLFGELYLRGLIQTKLYKEGPSRVKNWFHLLLIAILGGLIQGVAAFFLMLSTANYSVTLGSFSISIPLLALVGGIAAFSGFGLLNSWIFLKTQHILPAAIVQAALISWFLATFMVPL
jgi:hypothetical protein